MKDKLIKSICEEFSITTHMFMSRSQRGSLPTARYVYYYMSRKHGLFVTLSEIGESIERREQNASKGITKIEDTLNVDYNFRRRIKRIEKNL